MATTEGGVLQPGTLPRAAIVGFVLIAAVACIAWFGYSRDTSPPVERYLRLGASSAAALKRDLRAEFIPGTPVMRVIERLQRLGLKCAATDDAQAQWVCSITAATPNRHSLRLQASISTSNDLVTTLETAAEMRRP